MVEPSYAATTKYLIVSRFEVDGVVEKPDVIGAIFGQTEGLFGPELDLRELQRSGRIGRIEIQLESRHDKTSGTITVPSSLDRASTAIIAAAIDSIDRIGPCEARVRLEKIEDVRDEKRRAIMEKAKEILRRWVVEASPSTDEMVRQVSEALRTAEVVKVGPEGLPAGPEALESSAIIVVEGRADVINLLKCGIRNVVGIEGAKIPQTIIDLSMNKEVTAFLDGDRGGDLILKELMQVAKIDYVARAPPGREVEELSPKEVMKALRERVSISELGVPPLKPRVPDILVRTATDLQGTLEAALFDEGANEIVRLPVSELASRLPEFSNVSTLLFDGIVTQRLLDMAAERGIKTVIGDRVAEQIKKPQGVKVMTMSEILGAGLQSKLGAR